MDTLSYKIFLTSCQLIAFKHNIPTYAKSPIKSDQVFVSGEPQ